MKRFLLKRYIESVDPSEVDVEDREYAQSPEALIELYEMEEMQKLGENIYQAGEEDIYRIKKDDRGYYIVAYTLVETEEADEEEETFELFRHRLVKLDDNIYESANDPELDLSEYEECLVVLYER